jgi:hypothetical protein
VDGVNRSSRCVTHQYHRIILRKLPQSLEGGAAQKECEELRSGYSLERMKYNNIFTLRLWNSSV